jgi:hypothetical protein
MKVKLTISFKNGNKMKIIRNIGEPPKGTSKETHYQLECQELMDCITKNGLNVLIPPTQIDNVTIKTKDGDKKYGKTSCSSFQSRQALQ